jgi:uncharacterized protein YndB with AHSA1/START domain
VATVEQVVPVPPEAVFAVLADGWTYSDWVVGTAHIRAVDADWPALGSSLHHKVGPWPMSLRDRSDCLDVDPPHLLVLRARLWPLGEAVVRMTLAEVGPGQTRVRMDERLEAGPLRWALTKAQDVVLHFRNREALRRLGDLAVGRHRLATAGLAVD